MAESSSRHHLPGFDTALEGLRTDLVLMGNLVSRNFGNARAGFVRRAEDFCAAVIADDEEVDVLERQINRLGVDILMRFQPMVTDLRETIGSVKYGFLLERISDYAALIGRRTRKLIQETEVEEAAALKPVFEEVQELLGEALKSFSSVDLGLAESVRSRTGRCAEKARIYVDEYTDLIEDRPHLAKSYVNLMSIAQALEEICYLCGNISEEAIYIAEARDLRHEGNRLLEGNE
jgi:phosphate transport system protein